MRLRVARVTFAVLDFLGEDDRAAVAAKLLTESLGNPSGIFEHHPVLVGRGTISPSLPAGTFAWSFSAAGDNARDRDRGGLAEMIASVRRTRGRRRFRARDIVEHEGIMFIRERALIALAQQRDARAPMLRAALGLAEVLAKQPELLRPPARPFRPLAERRLGERGPAWTVAEDAALRDVFAQGAPRLSKREWAWLSEVGLRGERTRKAVLMRVERLGLRKRRC